MQRDYNDGVSTSVKYFIGVEVEKTAAYGTRTLFVVGDVDVNEVTLIAIQENVSHIYIGANKCFSHTPASETVLWSVRQLSEKFLITFDTNVSYIKDLPEYIVDNTNIIINVSVEIPNFKRYKNLSIKIDDIDFKATNPGVYIVNLNEIPTSQFTSWDAYTNDKIIHR